MMEADSKILRYLDEWQAEPEALPFHLQLFRDLLRCQSDFGPEIMIPPPRLSTDGARERLSKGLPLLAFGDLCIDWSHLPDMFCAVVSVYTRYPQFFGESLQGLLGKQPSTLWLTQAAEAWFDGDRLPAMEAGGGLDEGVMEGILQGCMRPFLARRREALLPLVDQGRWRRGYCPICGGNADLAWLDRETGARWLLCSRCDGHWLFQRLQCPFCDTTRQDALSYLTDEKSLYRLYLCDDCKSYLKAADLRSADDRVLLPVERILTLAYDVQALSDGYVAGNRKVALKAVARA